MASKGGAQVLLRGRFPAGTRVRLVEVKDESVLRSAGGKLVDTGKVSEDGEARFSRGVKAGARYFVAGYVDGSLREVRVRGNADPDDASLAQPPIQPDPVKLPDGRVVAELDNTVRTDTPPLEVQPAVRQDQVPEDVVQRSDTPLGAGTPITEDEVLPYPRQEDADEDLVQRSATETGQATPVGPLDGLGQQDAPKDLLQRSDTEYGSLTPIPDGDAVDATRVVQDPEFKNQGHPIVDDLGGKPPVAEGNSALNPLRDPDNDAGDEPNATDDQSGRVPNTPLAGKSDGPLAGAALNARAAELGIEGRGSMSADEKRKAIAKAEK